MGAGSRHGMLQEAASREDLKDHVLVSKDVLMV